MSTALTLPFIWMMPSINQMNFDSSARRRSAAPCDDTHTPAGVLGSTRTQLEETLATLPAPWGGGKSVDHGSMVDRGGTTGETS
jgi:hypothetical protein